MSGAALLTALGAADAIPGIDAIALPLTVGVLAVTAAEAWHAHQTAEQKLSDQPAAKPCVDCGGGPDCFEPPDRFDPKSLAEFRRQLKSQQDGINKMSPQDVIDNIDKYAAEGRGGYPGEAGMRKRFRQKIWNKAYDDALDETDNEEVANQEANAALEGKAALHNPDLVAGGIPEPTNIGGAAENSSIGSQWARKGANSKLTRAQQLKKAAERVRAEGKRKMDVTLDEC